MNLLGSSLARSRKPRLTSRLEPLETRCLLTKFPPAITIQELPNPANSGTTELIITGTKHNDSISINDNGTGAAGNMFVSYGNGQDYMSTGAVTAVDVVTGAGSDRVTYELDSNLQAADQEVILVGSGLKNGGGSVQFTVNIVGAINDGSNLLAIAVPDPKKLTSMAINDSGAIDGTFSGGISQFESKSLKPGPENFRFQSTANVGPDGLISTGMVGGKHNDVGSLTYSGINNGEIDVFEVGNGGSDQLGADVFMNVGSTGVVGDASDTSIVKGSGKDHLSFTIERGTDTTSPNGIFAQVIGTSKRDKVVHTGNVLVKTKGSVTLTP